MSDESIASRLDAMQTRWSLIRQAHGQGTAAAVDARRVLVLRYAPAIKSYVRGITRDEDAADELSQEVVVRLLQGDFAGADPDRGRFRDFLKTAVRNMVRNHWTREKRRATVEMPPESVAADADSPSDEWESGWTTRVLELAWSGVEEHERTHPDSLAGTVLRLRVEFPNASSEELASRLTQQAGREIRGDAVRQSLRRARILFAECLVREIGDGLENPSAERIEEELIDLGLASQVRHLLPDDWRTVRSPPG